MIYYKRIVFLGLITLLIGCSNYEVVDSEKSSNYVYHKRTKKIFYKYYEKGLPLPIASYAKVPSVRPKKFKPFNSTYATDGVLVFYVTNIIKGANPKGFTPLPEFPDDFAKDTINKIYYYKDAPLDLDFDTVKIHSLNYISDQYKVLLKDNSWDYDFSQEVAVEDIASFEVINYKSIHNNNKPMGKDKNWLYIENVRLPIASENAKIIKTDDLSTHIILRQGKLHYIIINSNSNALKNIPKHLQIENKGLFTRIEEKNDSYYHFIVSGFQNPEYIPDSQWFIDDNGLYFLNDSYSIRQVSDERHASYLFDPENPQYIRSNKALFANYTSGSKIFSASARIIDPGEYSKIVIDNDQLFYRGKLVPDVDTASFVKLKPGGYVDKNYYYNNVLAQNPIPHWAYEELKTGTLNSNELFWSGKTYWQGFLISMKQSKIDKATVELEFKNFERKTLSLNRPLEENLYFYYSSAQSIPAVYTPDTNIILKPESEYDYTEIKEDEIITFRFQLDMNKVNRIDYPMLTLSDQKKEIQYGLDDLYLRIDLTKLDN